MTRLALAFQGNLEKVMAQELRTAEKAVTISMKQAGLALKKDMRRDVRRARLGKRLANTWRSQVFPKRGNSLGAASFVFTKAPLLIRAFTEGVVIRARNSRFLAIPTPAAPATGTDGKRISPRNFARGQLRFIATAGGGGLLVVDVAAGAPTTAKERRSQLRRRSPRGALSRRREGAKTIVMFVLVPQVRLKKRLDPLRLAKRARDRLPGRIVKQFEKLDAKVAAGKR